jgi:hypothetical protein
VKILSLILEALKVFYRRYRNSLSSLSLSLSPPPPSLSLNSVNLIKFKNIPKIGIL